MPLLHKESFKRATLPDKVDSDDEVFYNDVTKEAFTDYESYFERAILCSSMVWTCSVTGRSGLTFQEAMESEQNANSLLNAFPEGLQLPVLYLVTFIREHKLPNIMSKITVFITNRFFVGEEVDVIVNDRKVRGVIRDVMAPESSATCEFKSISYGIDPALFNYEIECPSHENLKVVVGSERVTRTKNSTSKDKLRLFLKQHLVSEKRFEPMKLKQSSIEQFNIYKVKWDEIFDGPTPDFNSETEVVKIFNKDKVKAVRSSRKPKGAPGIQIEGVEKVKKEAAIPKKTKSSPAVIDEKPAEAKDVDEFDLEEKIRERDEMRKMKLEQKLREREKQKEEKRKREEYLLEWNKKRDDLECDDLVPLPSPIPIECSLPSNLFGDSMLLLEFFHNFSQAFDMKDVFPMGITLEVVEKTISETDIQGPFYDLTKILLKTIFSLQAEDEMVPCATTTASSDEDSEKEDDIKDEVIRSTIKSANATSSCIKQNHGLPLSEVEITPFSITEVLRLHILSSGAGKKNKNVKGWTSSSEDPCFWLRIEQPTIVEALSKQTMFELNAAERVILLKSLINQLLSFNTFRDYIEEAIYKVGNYNKRIKDLHQSFLKWDRENCVRKVSGKKQDEDGTQDSIPVVTDEQVEEYRRKKTKKSEELNRKIQQLKWQIKMTQGAYRLRPVGQDRLYQKYWIFSSIGGVFVDSEESQSTLLSKMHDLSANSNCSMQLNDLKNILKSDKKAHLIKAERTSNSDKENEYSSKDVDKELKNIAKSVREQPVERRNSCSCDGSKDLAINQKWSFYHTSQQIETLIASLNARGFRESELKSYLVAQKSHLLESLVKCPVHYLNKSLDPADRKSQRLMEHLHRKAFTFSYSDLKPSLALEKAFRDCLLDIEERIHNGRLGVMENREIWRKHLMTSENSESNVRSLAKALQILGKCIFRQNMQSPLSSDADVMERWHESLGHCFSISQLFLFISSLEKSIVWPNSGLRSCRICCKKSNAESMSYCWQCGRAYHTYCLQPPLGEVPTEKWYCFECKPNYVPVSPRKTKKIQFSYNESSDESDMDTTEINVAVGDPDYDDSECINSIASSQNSDSVDENNENLCFICRKDACDIACSDCSRNFHFACQDTRNTTRPSRRRWKCCACESKYFEEYEPRPKRTRTIPKYHEDYEEEDVCESPKETACVQRRPIETYRQTRIKSLPLDYKKCGDILINLARHEDSKYFHKFPKGKDAPKYNSVVKQHMDFGIIISKLNTGAYRNNTEFFSDIYLILKNCELYYSKNSDAYRAGTRLTDVLHKLMQENDLGSHILL